MDGSLGTFLTGFPSIRSKSIKMSVSVIGERNLPLDLFPSQNRKRIAIRRLRWSVGQIHPRNKTVSYRWRKKVYEELEEDEVEDEEEDRGWQEVEINKSP